MWEDYNVDDVLYVLGNPQKRKNTDVRISPMQFLRDRELGIRDEKHGIVIKEPVTGLYSRDRKCTMYPWLRDKYYEDDEYEKRHWWNRNVNVIKDDYY